MGSLTGRVVHHCPQCIKAGGKGHKKGKYRVVPGSQGKKICTTHMTCCTTHEKTHLLTEDCHECAKIGEELGESPEDAAAAIAAQQKR